MIPFFALACRAPSPVEVLMEADPSREGMGGEPGPWGVGFSEVRLARRDGRTFEVALHLPIDGDQGPFPVLVFVAGGKVAPERYHWLGEHLASHGVLVATPEYPLELAIFGGKRTDATLRGLRRLDEDGDPVLAGLVGTGPATLMGHSLGGVVAAGRWVKCPDDFGFLVMLASYPAGGADVEERLDPVLSITGSLDQRSAFADVEAGFERFGGPRTLAVVDGMNHYAWTDDPTAEELEGDGEMVESAEVLRPAALEVIDLWLAAEVGGDADAVAALAALDDGVSVRSEP